MRKIFIALIVVLSLMAITPILYLAFNLCVPVANAGEASESRVVIYTIAGCHYCDKAKIYMENHNITFTERNITKDHLYYNDLLRVTGVSRINSLVVPEIVIDGVAVGGLTDAIQVFNEKHIGDK